MSKIIFISSSQHFVDTFLKDLIIFLSKDHKISLATRIKNSSIYSSKIDLYNIPINRKISPISDLLTSIIFLKYLFKIEPDKIVTATPKTIIYGILARIFKPKIYRIHIYTGFSWPNMTGFKRKLLIYLDKLNISFADKIIFDSQSQIDFLNKNNFKSKKFHLIHNGSIKGVDCDCFYKFNEEKKIFLKKKYNIPQQYKVISYIGRIDSDKGIHNLIKSFEKLRLKIDNILLLLVGIDEMNIKIHVANIEKKIAENILIFNHSNNPEEIFNISNIFCLPSKREGFGNTVIESSACEVPVVGSDIFGLQSSLINGLNGLTFEVNNVDDLTKKLSMLLNDEYLCKKLGKKGREYVLKNFRKQDVFNSIKSLILN